MRQFIVEKSKLKNGLIELIGKDFRYLRQVLRVKNGDMLNVRFDDGLLQSTTVASIDDKNKKIILQVCAQPVEEENSVTRGVQANQLEESTGRCRYVLFQFVAKPQKMELIVRQATECGVEVIVPVRGEFSEKNAVAAMEGAKKERIERIIKEARQQSGSPVNTKVLSPVTLEEAVDFWNDFCGEKTAGMGESSAGEEGSAESDEGTAGDESSAGNPDGAAEKTDTASAEKSESLAVVLWERTDGTLPLKKLVEQKKDIKKACIAVGSEGGISPEEVKFLQKKGLFVPVHFAVNILRCETAALYGIAAVQSAILES